MAVPRRLTLALASAAVAAALGLGAWYVVANYDVAFLSRGEQPTLRNGGLMRELLSERARAAGDHDRAGGKPAFDGTIPEEDARRLFAMLDSVESVYDPLVWWRRAPDLRSGRRFPEAPRGTWVLRTNAQGFREDAELPDEPDRRVLVIGDSHTDGVCGNWGSFANLLEADLKKRHAGMEIDVVNAGVGGYSFYNYLHGMDRFVAELGVDVYVCAVYGGNDFLEMLAPRHYFERTAIPTGGERYGRVLRAFEAAWGDDIDAVVAQGVQQLAFLTVEPGEAELALDTARRLTRAMARRAEELGVALVFVYLPSAWDVQLERFTDVAPAELLRALELDGEGAVRSADPWTDAWLAEVSDLGVPVVDMRPAWRDVDEDRYWHQDHHIDVRAQADVARALVEVVEPLLEL